MAQGDFVQCVAAAPTATNPTSVITGVVNGNTLVAWAIPLSSGVTSVTDDKGNSWSSAGGIAVAWIASNVVGGTVTVTFHTASSTECANVIAEYEGNMVAGLASINTGGPGTSIASGNISTSSPATMLGLAYNTGSVPFTFTSGYTARHNALVGSILYLTFTDKIGASAGTHNFDITCSFAGALGAAVLELQPAAAAGGQPFLRRLGGVPFVGGQIGLGNKGGGKMWGRHRSGIIVPRRFAA